MKLLVTNDDGVASPGLWALADALRDAGHDVVVVAPAEERSGSGAAIGLLVPGQGVEVSPVERSGWDGAAWAVDGPPALCVLLAVRQDALGQGFDAVVSGINPGWNTGRGVLHSGTVGAVLTGGTSGLPGVAVSIDAPTTQVGEVGLRRGVQEHWGTAAAMAVEAVSWLGGLPPAADGAVPAMVNLNVPNRPFDEVPGVRPALLARASASGERQPPPRVVADGRLRLELGPPALAAMPESDNAQLLAGWATVTLLTGIGEGGGEGEDGAAGVARRLGDLVARQAATT